ncbi:MAG: collagen binding domain-containing protein [Kofleriaceae bacterium]
MLDDDPRGTLRLEGQVVAAGDVPVAGATVVLSSNPPRTAVTEADGGFSFDGLIGRPYTLIARAGPMGIAGPITARLSAHSDPVILQLRPGAQLEVAVVDGSGKPIDRATVELRGFDETRATTKAGKAAFSAVVPGGYQLAAWSDRHARSLQWIQITAGGNTAEVRLAAGAAASGQVLDDKGSPVAGARVVYRGASDWSQQADERLDAVTTSADGTFSFDALPAGSFRFVANHRDFATGSSALVTLDGKTERGGIVIALARGAVVRGKVVDASKQPVASARVRIATSGQSMFAAGARQAFTDATGAFEIKALPRTELLAIALHDAAASDSVVIDASASDPPAVTLELDVTGTIAGVVVDGNGQPIEGAQVSAGPNFRDAGPSLDIAQWRLRGFPRELTDAAGAFKLGGLAPGSYIITARPAHAAARARRSSSEGVAARTGQTDVRLVLLPEGAVKGKVTFPDGSTPTAFSVAVGMEQQSFVSGGEFVIDELAPQRYQLTISGPGFDTRAIDATIESSKTTDLGTITVQRGRSLAGVVVADGKPVAGATVYAGRMIFGSGTSASAPMGMMGRSTKQAITDNDGRFSLSGFGPSDLSIVAEHLDRGRSKSLRLPPELPGQTELTLELQPFGSVTGVLRQGGKPAEGVLVTCQSTTTPGAIFTVGSGADGVYRFDKLAPDIYKISATLGMPMTGMKFYSKQITVPPGKLVTIDLAVEPGAVTLTVIAKPRTGALGVANVWLASGTLVAQTAREVGLQHAAMGPGASQWKIVTNGGPAVFEQVAAGSYTACAVPMPIEVKGMAAMPYQDRHGDTLPAFCKAITVRAAGAMTSEIPVEIPALEPEPGDGSGSGSGSSR